MQWFLEVVSLEKKKKKKPDSFRLSCCFAINMGARQVWRVGGELGWGGWVGCGLCWVYERAAGKFFFSAFYFRGIRDDIEEEDEQVSEPPPLFSAPSAATTPLPHPNAAYDSRAATIGPRRR